MAGRFQAGLQLLQRRQVSGSQLHHPADQIDTPHLLGDAVFDLQTCVHFQKVEALILTVEDEFDGACAAVIDRSGEFDGCRAKFLGHAVGQVGGRGFFQHFLVAALHRAVTHAQGQHLALTVTKHLHFQMAGTLDVFLDEHTRVAEIVLAEALYRLERVCQLFSAAAHSHADAATACRALEHDRIADITRRCDG